MRLCYVGAALRMLRTARGYSVLTLAERIGTNRQVIYRYESGRGYPSLRMLFDVLTALEVDLRVFQQAIDDTAEEERRRSALLDPPTTTR